MTGVSLSRWTMAYFAAALLSLLAAESMMASGYGFPAHGLRAPETLVLVHVTSIGWLSLLMCGALHQFVPVLVARPLHDDKLPMLALIALLAGLSTLVLGFLHLAGTVPTGPGVFVIAAGLLGFGFAIIIWNLGRTLREAWPIPLSARFVAVALFALAATFLYGTIFALALGGVLPAGPLHAVFGEGLPLHAIAGLGGWLTFAAMGVSYRLLAMFMLAPELDGRRPNAAYAAGTAAVAIVVIGGSAAIVLNVPLGWVLAIAAIPGLIALALYCADMIHLYRARKRRRIELNSRMAAVALMSLFGAVLLMLVLQAMGKLAQHIGAVVFLVTFGWLTGLGLAKLYKIVAFLTWLETYGPLLGRRATPRVQDLVIEERSTKWFVGYFLATFLATAALLSEQVSSFRIAAAGMLIATLGIATQILRTRRLADIGSDQFEPIDPPRLLYARIGESKRET